MAITEGILELGELLKAMDSRKDEIICICAMAKGNDLIFETIDYIKENKIDSLTPVF